MTGKIFTDTNVLIYLYGDNDPKKKDKIEEFFIGSKNSRYVWSTQVVQEYYYKMTNKYKCDPDIVRSSLSVFENFELVINDYQIITEAIDIQKRYKLSFWDSLIISSASKSKCSYLFSEDLYHGQIVEGVEIVNPFLV